MNVYMKEKTRVFCQNSFDDLDDNIGIVMPILTECDVDEDFTEGIEKVGDTIPILPLRNMVLFPGVALPVIIGRPKSMRLIKEAVHKKSLIGVVCQKEMGTEDPILEDLYTTGVIADIVRVLEMPDGSTTVILQGKKRFELNELTETDPYLSGKITVLEDTKPDKTDREFEALISTIKDLTIKMLGAVAEPPRDLIFSIKNNKNVLYVVNFSCSNIPSGSAEKQQLLLIGDLKERAYRLLFILNREYQLVELKASIQMKTHEDINQQQKEYFLQQQIKTIQEELGGNINELEIKELREKASRKKWPAEVAQVFEKELRKLERLHPQSPDYSVQTQYVQNIVNLPWNEYSKDNFNLSHAQKVLDRDHYGLEKVKERIIEHLAVLKLKGDMKSPIICLYGPPGVGKTSLGRSIAEALRRKYVRVSLGGLHDEAEIRGHRRTYIGAMCGRIIQNIQKAGTSNPVFILDEIDKITNDFKGDPASALLEVLDPEQNNAFHDNYLDIDYDLSKVMFIATANNLNTISQPLLDRMELIEVSGYIMEEKVEIAAKHLVPKQMDVHGLKKGSVKFPKKTLQVIVEAYTRESGVRELDKKIAKKRLIKQGAMQQLLTGKKRLPGFTDSWVEKKLGEILDYEQPQPYLVVSTDYVDSGIPVLTAGKSRILGYTTEQFGIYNKLPVIIFDDFTTDSKYISYPFKVKSSAMKVLSLKNNDYDLRLVYELMQQIDFPLKDHQRYWISEYSQLTISIPKDREEQTAIATILTDMDKEIADLEAKRDKYSLLKSGMMQKLLTGQIRLKINRI